MGRNWLWGCVMFVLIGAGCDGDSTPTGDAKSGGDAVVGDSATGDGSGGCSPGTCRLTATGSCTKPTGPTGNGCCSCGANGMCDNFCKCAAPDTPVATPAGPRPIAALSVGDRVYSMHRGQLSVVPIRQTSRCAARNHRVVQVVLEGGAVLQISPSHPTSDGRTFGELAAGDLLDGVPVARATSVRYQHAYTHDILPDSDTGTYLAAGVLIGSTLFSSAAP